MAWLAALLVVLVWYLHGHSHPGPVHSPWPTGGTPDAGGLTPQQKAVLIRAQNAAAAALKGAGATDFLLLRWVEIRLYQQGKYITILEDGTSDFVNYTVDSLRNEVCHYTTAAADLVNDQSLVFCP